MTKSIAAGQTGDAGTAMPSRKEQKVPTAKERAHPEWSNGVAELSIAKQS